MRPSLDGIDLLFGRSIAQVAIQEAADRTLVGVAVSGHYPHDFISVVVDHLDGLDQGARTCLEQLVQ